MTIQTTCNRAPANAARGEVTAVLGGVTRRLCLTLGALARIEEALELEDWSQLPGRIARMSARDLLAVLQALLDDEDGAPPLDVGRLDVREAAAAVAKALAAAV
ncbi:GTA-gp10 family protein [Caulobacter hibisci]|uniref:Gene transfer agent family protein n=1 Tax=Caulobacter hibisci TaxID=2035993 RepID=A0ABS0T282_9CAUL|nr:GTA-gp10 family protein [Caulobacter hibisci]MBI1685836.1 gene transfer agent family protein [Caulobacter hibisci]